MYLFYSKSRNQENNEGFLKQLYQSLLQGTTGMRSLLNAILRKDLDFDSNKPLEQIR